MFPALSGQIILDVESPTEILADKLLSYAWRIAPAATRPVGHVLVGVERRRRFPTGDGACGIEII